jgi:hypothetical protein
LSHSIASTWWKQVALLRSQSCAAAPMNNLIDYLRAIER